MKTKTYIAALFAFIFLAKLAAIDANGLNFLSSGMDITFVNHPCKNKNSPIGTDRTTDLSQPELVPAQTVALNGSCNPYLHFEPFQWEMDSQKPIADFYEHFSQELKYRYLDNDSPPPRLS